MSEIEWNKKIIIYGAGEVAKQIQTVFAHETSCCELVAYAVSDLERNSHTVRGLPIITIKDIEKYRFDYIIIASYNQKSICEMLDNLEKLHVRKEKIIEWGADFWGLNIVPAVRYLWIEKIARWMDINAVQGCVAECGVYIGDSAKFINSSFPDRTLYLFDTFEGFDDRDLDIERSMGNENFLNGRFNTESDMFNKSNEDIVLKKMEYPDKVIIKKGYFPLSASAVDERFAFVNLDMDLYKPMLEALRFFWGKMEQNGCILLHDYFIPSLPGVKLAVDEFEKEIGQVLFKIPIGDDWSLAIFKM